MKSGNTHILTTPGAFDRTHNGGVDCYVAKLLPDGSGIVYFNNELRQQYESDLLLTLQMTFL